MAYETGRDLKKDILFRAGEPEGSTTWGSTAIDYVNRTYRALAMGASEFLPENVEDWWWLRGRDVLNLDPVIDEGSANVTKDNDTVVLSDAPSKSVEGWRFKVDNHPEIYKVESHAAGTTLLTLDGEYTGNSDTAAGYKLMRTDYDLVSEVAGLISPMQVFYRRYEIIGMTPERFDHLFPLAKLRAGVPVAFALEDERTVRFSHGGRLDGQAVRVEYKYRPVIDDIEDSTSSKPLVPLQYRHILADMALAYVLMDKNDDRANAAAATARGGLMAMVRENKRRIAKMDVDAGVIFPRGKTPTTDEGPIRTNAGLIIG